MPVNSESGKYGVKCKFYRAGKPESCRNGEDCYFIHDDQAPARSRRNSRSISHEEANYNNYSYQNTHYVRKVAIDPKYKYIADKAKSGTGGQSVVTVTITNNTGTSPAALSRRNSLKDAAQDESAFYSSSDKLSKEDCDQFQADEFILGLIPLVPPALSMA